MRWFFRGLLEGARDQLFTRAFNLAEVTAAIILTAKPWWVVAPLCLVWLFYRSASADTHPKGEDPAEGLRAKQA